MRVLLTGATGLVGRQLGKELVRQGHELTVLVRQPQQARNELPFPAQIIAWDGRRELEVEEVGAIDAVIHLAGESVAGGRWTKVRKEQILSSRVQSAQALLRSLEKCRVQPKVFITASAVGIYGNRGEEILKEESTVGKDFLADVCAQWEASSRSIEGRSRWVALRIGVVLSPNGGFLSEVGPLFRTNAAGPLGNGQQWMSWIHIDDLIRLILFSLENEKVSGSINAVSPQPVRNKEMTVRLASQMGVMAWLPAPSLGLKLALGEMADMLLASQRVSSQKILDLGFQFQYPDVQQALDAIYSGVGPLEELFVCEQWLPISRDKVWSFFSSEENLEAITPPWLGFHVVGKSTQSLAKKSVIDYRLKIHGIPLRWRTLIDEWIAGERFVDEQLKGPYAKWRHTHEFEDLQGGTLIRDRVVFKLPLGHLGQLVAGWYVRSDVQKIFKYRKTAIAKHLSP